MLSKKLSKKLHLSHFVSIASLIMAFIIFSSFVNIKDQRSRKGDKLQFEGHEIIFSTFPVIVTNIPDDLRQEDNEILKRYCATTAPDTLPSSYDQWKVYQSSELTKRPEVANGISILRQLLDRDNKLFSQLPDGKYTITLSHMIINEDGKIIYHARPYIHPPVGQISRHPKTGEPIFSFSEMTFDYNHNSKNGTKRGRIKSFESIPADRMEAYQAINSKLDVIIRDAIQLEAGEVNGKKVLSSGYFLSDALRDESLVVKDRTVTVEESDLHKWNNKEAVPLK